MPRDLLTREPVDLLSGEVDKRAEIESVPTREELKYDPSVSRTRYLINQAGEGAVALPSLVGLPFDVAAKGANKLSEFLIEKFPVLKSLDYPAPENMSSTIREGLRFVFGTTEMKAPDAPTRYAGAVAEFAGAGTGVSAKIVASAVQKVPAIASEIISTVGGGVGSEFGGDVSEKSGVGRGPGELIGGVSGGIGGAVVTPTVTKAVQHIKAKIPQEVIDTTKGIVKGVGEKGSIQERYQTLTGNISTSAQGSIKKEAGRQINAAVGAHPASVTNIDEAERIARELERLTSKKPTFTIAQKTGAPEMGVLEQRLAQEQGEYGRYVENYRKNLSIVEGAKDTMFPKGKMDVTRAASTLYTQKSKVLDARIKAVENSREAIAAKTQGVSLETVGSKLKSLRGQQFNLARATKDTMIEDVYQTADRLKVKENMTDIFGIVRKVGGDDQNIFQNMPPAYGAVLRRYGKQTEEGFKVDPEKINTSFKEFHSLWKETNRQYYSAVRAGDSQAEFYLNQLRNSLNERLAKFEGQGYGELSKKFYEFNRFYKEEYHPVFKQGLGAALSEGSRLKAGAEFVPEEKVIAKFFSPSGMDDFTQIYAGDPAAKVLLEDGVVGLFAEKVVKDGLLSRTAASTFLRSHAETLNKIPDVKRKLIQIISDDSILLGMNEKLLQKKVLFDRSVLTKIANTPDLENFISKSIADKKLLTQILSIKNVEARKSSIRTIVDSIPALAAKEKISPSEFLDANQKMLKPLFSLLGKEHWKNARLITAAQDILERVKLPQSIEISKKIKTPLEEATGISEVSLQSQLRAATITKQTGLHRVAVSIGARWLTNIREKEAQKLMHAAIYDPEIAKDLALALKIKEGSKAGEVVSNKIRNHLYGLGIKTIAISEDNQ